MSSKSFVGLFCLAFLLVSARAKDEKLKPEQLIEKHLESIGSAEARKALKARISQGTAHVTFRVGGTANMDGAGTILSDGDSIRIGLKFPSQNYPGEQLAFDGKQVNVGQISPGVRFYLAQFIFENDEMLKEGLLFGSLSTSWALLNQGDRQAKLDVSGPKKIEGRNLYELRYQPKHRSGNVTTFLYFDAETFRHVRSEFKAEHLPVDNRGGGGGGGGGRGGRGGGGGGGGGDRSETVRTTIVEHFDDFKLVDGVTLPHSYKLDFTIDSPNGGFVGTWTFTATQVVHNQPIDPKLFSLN
jgi:hypothetical protein